MIYARPGQTIEPELDGAPTGLTGTIGVRLIDPPGGAVLIARTTAGITESAPGVYTATLTIPDPVPDESLLLVWDLGDPADPDETFTEELEVNETGTPAFPAGPLAEEAAARVGRLLRERTKPRNGTGPPLGAFTENTEPTYDQVLKLVYDARDEVFITAGNVLTDATEPAAWALIAIRAAMLVELGYPVDQRHSQYDRLKDLYETGLKRLQDAVGEEAEGGELGPGDDALLPLWSFDDCVDLGVPGAERSWPADGVPCW